MKPITLSIIIPVFNGEKYIAPLLDKILNNPFKNFEILIGDDQSTDHTFEIISKYKILENVHVLRPEKKLFAGGMRNFLINKANGDYIAIQDADDDFDNLRFLKQVEFLNKNKKTGVVGSWCRLKDPIDLSIWGAIKPQAKPTRLDWFLQKSMVHASIMFRKNCKELSHYHPSLVTGEDYYFITSLFWKNVKFANIEEPLYFYHIKKNDLKTRNKRLYLDLIKSLPIIGTSFPMGTRTLFISLNIIKVTIGALRGLLLILINDSKSNPIGH